MKKMNLKSLKFLIPLLLVALIPTVVKGNYLMQVACNILIYCYFASSWNIIGGVAGQFAMGNGLYIGLGCYCCAVAMQSGSNPFVATIVAVLLSLILSYCISSLCFRLSGTYFSLATVAFLYISRFIVVSNDYILGFKIDAARGLILPWTGKWYHLQFRNKVVYYYIFLVALCAVLFVTYKIMKSKMGIYLAAIRTNPGAAATIGIPVTNYKMYAQCLSASLLAIGGILYTTMIMQVDPQFCLGYDLSLQVMIFCVIGGKGTLFGPVIGATFLMLIKEFIRINMGVEYAQFSLVLFGVMLCLCILFSSDGLYGLATRFFAKVKTKFLAKKQAEGKECQSV